MKRKRRRVRKASISQLRKKCDALWARLIVARDVKCQRCSGKDFLQAHHIVRRSRSSWLRHNLNNGMTLCRNCHIWWHNAAEVEAVSWTETMIGSGRMAYLIEELYSSRRAGWKPTAEHYHNILAGLEELAK